MTSSVLISNAVKGAGFLLDHFIALSYSFYDMLVLRSLEIAVIILYRAAEMYTCVHVLVCYGQRLPSHQSVVL